MILKIIAGIVVVVAALLVFASTRPNSFRIQRSISVFAPPEKIFPLINDFHNWKLWAPQDREDSSMRREYSGPDSGVGAISDWDSAGSAGKGKMTITESEPSKHVLVQVDWEKPFATRNVNDFAIDYAGNTTRVTWTMEGKNLFPMKVMGLFVNMDKMMGRHFETGLASLKAAAEK